MNLIKNYFTVAFRNLKRKPGYTLINGIGLVLGLSCGILIFTLIKYHLSFDTFHPDTDRVYRIVTEEHNETIGYNSNVPSPLGKAFRDNLTFGESVARVATFGNLLISIKNNKGSKKFKETIAFAEPNFFDIFNFPLLQGNPSTVLKEPNTAIITEKIAEKYFPNQNPINQTFSLDNQLKFKVKGILKDLPKNTDFQTEIYLSYTTLKAYDEWLGSDDAWGGIRDGMKCFVRLRPNIQAEEVEKTLFGFSQKYRPDSKHVHHYKLQALHDVHFNAQYNGPMNIRNLWALGLIGFIILITACVNFINLATAQALNRSREVGLRKVLGGLRQQIFWQFMLETSLITLLATLISIELSFISLPWVNFWFQSEIPTYLLFDWKLALFIPLLMAFVIFLAGSYPGLVLANFQPVTALKGRISQNQIGGFNTRRLLIITQLSISQVLIIGVIVIYNQMSFIHQADLGYDKDAVITIPLGAGTTATQAKTLKNEFLNIPGVEKVSLCFTDPGSTNSHIITNIRYEGKQEDEDFSISYKGADAEYVPTFNLQLVAGRNLLPSDTVKEFVVNENLVKKLHLASPEEIIGKKIAINGGRMEAPIVGVVKDFHEQSFREEFAAMGITTNPNHYNLYAVKLNPQSIPTTLEALKEAYTAQHPDLLYEYSFLDEQIAEYYIQEETMLKLLQVFAFIAIFIGCLGLYGLISFMAAQKNREIGIRKVLGATMQQILWLFGKEFTRLVLIAFLVAAPIAWGIMQEWLNEFVFRISLAWWMFLLGIGISFFIVVFTVAMRAIKAALANPVEVLKTE